MSLQVWLEKGWIRAQQPSREEVQELLALADRDLSSSQTARAAGMPPEWCLIIAYNAALQSAAAALAAAGFEVAPGASHHYYLIESLRHTVAAPTPLITVLDKLRQKRNATMYQHAGHVSEPEANRMYDLARQLRADVEAWLRRAHPELL
jgi:HEPN domain